MQLDKLYAHFQAPQLSKGEKKKLALLKAAYKEVADKGPFNFNYTNVAEQAKVPRSLVAHYFPERDELLAAVFKLAALQGQELTIALMDQQKTPWEKFLVWSSLAFKLYEQNLPILRILCFCSVAASTIPAIRKVHSEMIEMGALRGSELLKLDEDLSHLSDSQRRQCCYEVQVRMSGVFICLLNRMPAVSLEELYRQFTEDLTAKKLRWQR